jgi:DNA primase
VGSSDPIVQEVLARTSLVEVVQEFVPLKKMGRSTWKGLCPFHSEKTPSFNVNEEKKLFFCFGCQTGGNAITFLKLAAGLTGQEALRRLAEKAGVTLPDNATRDPAEDAAARTRADLSHAVQAAQEFFRIALAGPRGANARTYLESRGIPVEVADRYGLGFGGDSGELLAFLDKRKVPVRHAVDAGVIAPSQSGSGYYERFRGRLVCPVLNLDGAAVAFSARLIPPHDDGPKYVNSPESPLYIKGEAVFGLHVARAAIRQAKQAVLVEGNFDVLALAAAGVPNVVAPLGTALTNAQLRLLRRFAETVVVMFDGDEAGRKASRRAVGLLIEEGIEGYVAEVPPGQDPDTIARSGGEPAVRMHLDRARPMVTYLLDALVEIHGRTPHGLRKVVDDAREVFQHERDAFRMGRYREEMARVLDVDVRELARLLRDPTAANPGDGARSTCPAAERTLLELLLLHPHLIQRFLDDEAARPGLLVHPEAREVFQDLVNASLAGEDPAEAFVLSADSGGPVRTAVSRILQNPERYPDTDSAYLDCLKDLERAQLERRREDLESQRAVAESEGNEDEANRLLGEVALLRGRILSLSRANSAAEAARKTGIGQGSVPRSGVSTAR